MLIKLSILKRSLNAAATAFKEAWHENDYNLRVRDRSRGFALGDTYENHPTLAGEELYDAEGNINPKFKAELQYIFSCLEKQRKR